MDFFQTLTVICFAALLTLAVWQVRNSLNKRRIGGKRTAVRVILDAHGSAGELEQSVKGLIWLMANNTLYAGTEIVISNAGASPETTEMARILECEYPGVVAVND